MDKCEFKGKAPPKREHKKVKLGPKCLIINLHDIKIYCLKYKIKCLKYNYSLDEIVRNQSYQHSEIMVDHDIENLIIMHYKPITSLEGTEFSYVKSNCSCSFKEIKSFVLGPSSSTFWMTRKHINSNL